MSNDITIMKTAIFGGFKKSDVLALVENLQHETADTRMLLDEKRKEALAKEATAVEVNSLRIKNEAQESRFRFLRCSLYRNLTMNYNHNVTLYLRPEWAMI